MKARLALVAALALLVTQSPALAQPQSQATPKHQCFSASQITNYRVRADERALNLRVGAREVYQLEMLGPCPDLDFSSQIGVRSRGGAMTICSGLDAVIVAPSTRGPRRCEVKSVRRLTDQEVATLPSRERP